MLITRGNLSGLIIIVLILLISCEFNLHDPPVTQLTPPGEAPPIQISLNNAFDTIKIDWKSSLSYNVTGNNQILSVSVVFEEKEIHHYLGEYGQTFSFVLDPSAYPNGIYSLRIEIITASGTGSLAEKLGAEGFLYHLDWPVVIDNTPPVKLNFISIDSLTEGVRITWEKFDHVGFRYYKLAKSPYSSNSIDLVTYYDPSQTSFIDTAYLEGEVVYYSLELAAKSSGINSSTTNKIEYFQVPHAPKITTIKDFEVELSWDPPRNLNLLDYYYIHNSKPTVSIREESKIFDPYDRTRTTPVTFGTKNYFGLLYVPKPYKGLFYTGKLIRGETEFQPGEIMPEFHYACPVRNTDLILLSNKGKIYKYNLSSGILMDSVVTHSEYPDYFTVSNDGSYFGYSENGKFITRATIDFRLLHSMSNVDYTNNIGILLRFSVSNTGRLMLILENNTVIIFDLTTDEKIAERKIADISWMVGAISPDGNYILTQEFRYGLSMVYYQITGDQIIAKDKIVNSGLKFFTVIPNPFGPDQDIYIHYNTKVEIRNITDFSVRKVLQLSGIQYIDYHNMKAVGNSITYVGSNLGYLYDLQTETVIKDLLVSYMNNMIFHCNYLISPSGRKMILNTTN